MATRCFVKILLVSHLACMAIALPLTDSAPGVHVENRRSKFSLPDNPIKRDSSHLATEKAAVSDGESTQSKPSDLTALEQTRKILKLATLLPAETLQLLRKIVVPLMNSSIAMPAKLLEEAAIVPPSNELHRIGFPIGQAGLTLADKISKSVENLTEADAEASPRCFFMDRQFSCTGLKQVFNLLLSHVNKVGDTSEGRIRENRARQDNVLEGSLPESAIRGAPAPESTTSEAIHSEKASKPLVTSKFGNFIFGTRANDRV